jgi:membrane protein DedA with SNARE-associated domain
MDRNTILWTLVVFFAGTVLFGTIRNATDDQPVGVTLGVQALVGIVLVGAIVLFVRRRR